jgi:hypothetical protein
MQRKATAPAISSGCPALERGAVGDTLIVRAVGAARRIDRGLDIARCHRVDPDSCLGPGQCHALVRVADPNVARLNIAQSFGAKAHPVGDASQRFALIVECSGAHAARNLGIEVVLPRGALVLVGENAESWTIEEGKVFRRKDFYMIRTFYFSIANFAPISSCCAATGKNTAFSSMASSAYRRQRQPHRRLRGVAGQAATAHDRERARIRES